MSRLFEPFVQRGLTLPNRIVMSPMCQYSGTDGVASEWHLVHLGARAVGGVGTLIQEATAVLPEGRICPTDLGIWNDQQVQALAPINAFISKQGAVPGIQLSHAGRKASAWWPWAPQRGGLSVAEGGWTPQAPSAVAYDDDYNPPEVLDQVGIDRIIEAFAAATDRALAAGFKLIELHAAHGYLLNEFLSPLSNQRNDDYGGSFENRTRLLQQVVKVVRERIPDELPLWVRLSATDWIEGGWDLEQTVSLARLLQGLGVDLIDVSTGGVVRHAEIPTGPGYQTYFSAEVRRRVQIATGAVGIITEAIQAEHVLRSEQADLVFIGRELLLNPYWPLQAAQILDERNVPWPAQYVRGAPTGTPIRSQAAC